MLVILLTAAQELLEASFKHTRRSTLNITATVTEWNSKWRYNSGLYMEVKYST